MIIKFFGTLLLLLSFSVKADDVVLHHISAGIVNSGVMTGVTQFATMETMLRNEAVKICGTNPSVRILIKDFQVTMPRNGAFSLTAEGCEEGTAFFNHAERSDAVTLWGMYPQVSATAKIACKTK